MEVSYVGMGRMERAPFTSCRKKTVHPWVKFGLQVVKPSSIKGNKDGNPIS